MLNPECYFLEYGIQVKESGIQDYRPFKIRNLEKKISWWNPESYSRNPESRKTDLLGIQNLENNNLLVESGILLSESRIQNQGTQTL